MQDLMRTQNASEISLINDNSSSSIPESSSSGGNSGSSFFNLGSNSNHSNYSNYSNNDLSAGDIDNFDGHGSFSSLGESSHTLLLKRDDYNDNPDTDEDAIYNDSMGSDNSFFFASEDSTNDDVLIESIRIRRKGGRRSSVRQMMQLPGDGVNNDELGLALQSSRDRHRRLRESLHNSSLHGYSPTSKLSPITTTSQSTPPTRNTTTTTGIDSGSGGENNLRSRLSQLSINAAAGGGSDLLE